MKIDSTLPADTLLFVSLDSENDILLCGTYFLQENKTDDRGRLRAIRKGEILAIEYAAALNDEAHNGADDLIVSRAAFDSGVLDLQPLSAKASDPVSVMSVHSTGDVSVIKVQRDASSKAAVSLERIATSTIQKSDDASVLALSVSTGVHSSENTASNTACVSDSIGGISVFNVADDHGLTVASSWKAHDFECWTVDMECRDGKNCIASGGDDTKLCFWDTRNDLSKPTSTVRFHSAGVCSTKWHPTEPHLFASGSYDEQLAIWDVRSLSKPLVTQNVGGGVWRIRWLTNEAPSDTTQQQTIATATMYAGAHVVIADLNAASSRVVEHYRGHGSIVYGAEWLPSSAGQSETKRIASCSFYDHTIHFWSVQLTPTATDQLEKDLATTKI